MSSSDPAMSPLNFIYACSICCRSFSDVYEGHSETVQGLSDGINCKERLVTRLWLASCCHVFCSSHMEGGGPSFHPEEQRPKGVCPVCVQESNLNLPRDLYSIRGFHKDEYDPLIPPTWFDAPPAILDEKGKDIEALRFQYLSLVRYCQNAQTARKPSQNALARAETEIVPLQKLATEERSKVIRLEADVERIHSLEQEIEQYRRLNFHPNDLTVLQNNKEEITKYLKLVPNLVEQNRKMKERLASLGFAMALEPVPNLKPVDLNILENDAIRGAHNRFEADTRSQSSNDQPSNSASMLEKAGATSSPFFRRPLKRQRRETPVNHTSPVNIPSVRNGAPPSPTQLKSRMSSIRRILPSIARKVIAHTPTSPAGKARLGQNISGGVQWSTAIHPMIGAASPAQFGTLSGQSPSLLGQTYCKERLKGTDVEYDEPMIVHKPSKAMEPRTRHDNPRSIPLNSQPSYLQLMDGLSWNDNIELNIKNPQAAESTICQVPGGPHVRLGTSLELSIRRAQYPHSSDKNPGVTHKERKRESENTASRHTRSERIIDSVVSRLSHSEQRSMLPLTGTRLAEPHGSSTCFHGYRSPDPQQACHPSNHSRFSLNKLSFFDKPLDSHNQPIPYLHRERYEYPVRQLGVTRNHQTIPRPAFSGWHT